MKEHRNPSLHGWFASLMEMRDIAIQARVAGSGFEAARRRFDDEVRVQMFAEARDRP
jgi:hypothetical protein